ncbi:MAG: VOC family protein [Acidimicrobiales bacterium]
MISGVHGVMFAEDADAARRFVSDVLEWPSVDAGGGWMLFACPPAEVGFHPTEKGGEHHELYLMCDDIEATVAELTENRVHRATHRRGVRAGGMDQGPRRRQPRPVRAESPDRARRPYRDG